MDIRVLHRDDLHDVLDLFCECFADDHYYKRQFPNDDTRASQMRDEFKCCLEFCLTNGYSVGTYNEDRLIGFALLFNYHETLQNHRSDFDAIFCADENGDIPYYEEIHQRVQGLKGKTLYLLSIAVLPEYRRMGIIYDGRLHTP